MELFREDGCLSDEGLHALTAGQLDELGRLEAAEHLAYCDKCTDRYTALLTADALADPPRDVRRTVMSTIWVRLMQSTCGRAAVAGVAKNIDFFLVSEDKQLDGVVVTGVRRRNTETAMISNIKNALTVSTGISAAQIGQARSDRHQD